MLINVGIEIGITLAGVGIVKLNQYIKENNPEAAGISGLMRDLFNGARAFLDPNGIEIEEIKR